MITLELSTSGSALARALRYDEEELAYCLSTLAEEEAEKTADDVAAYLSYDAGDAVVKMLRRLASGIEQSLGQQSDALKALAAETGDTPAEYLREFAGTIRTVLKEQPEGSVIDCDEADAQRLDAIADLLEPKEADNG